VRKIDKNILINVMFTQIKVMLRTFGYRGILTQ
jgi:hypothetical protein